jgi:uncharacterized protein with FMN-binding domain
MKGRLIALSSAAVLAVYTAGYARTRSAAEMLEAEERRPPMPRPGSVDRTPIPPAPVQGPETSAPPTRAAQTVPASAGEHAIPPATPEIRRGAATVLATAAAETVPSRTRAVASDPSAGSPGAHDGSAAITTKAAAPAADVAVRGSATGVQPETTIAAASSSPSGVPVATGPIAAIAPSVAPPAPTVSESGPAPAVSVSKWKDGHYTGWGTSRHGDIQASVFIENGRIATASIAQCLTRYPCDWIVKLPPQVVQRQSAETDYVSGATESTNAFYYAVLEALGKAAK